MKKKQCKLMNSNTPKNGGFARRFLTLLLAVIMLLCGSACQSIKASALENEEAASVSDGTMIEEAANELNSGVIEEVAAAPAFSDFCYTLYVLDENELPISGASICLYANDAQLFTGMTDEEGKLQWMLSAGQIYRAEAELEGYELLVNESRVETFDADVSVKIIMHAVTAAPAASEEENQQSAEQPASEEQPLMIDNPLPEETSESGNMSVKVADGAVVEESPAEVENAVSSEEQPAQAAAPIETPASAEMPVPEEAVIAEPAAAPVEAQPEQAAQYPVAEEFIDEQYTVTESMPVPANDGGMITFYAPDVTIDPSEAGFDLMKDVYGVNEANEQVYVWVVNDGGFSSSIPGTYVTEYAAVQGNEIVSVTRTITVNGEAVEKEVKPAAPTGSSSERNKELLAYRDEIYTELAPRIEALGKELNEFVATLIADKQNVQYMKQVPLWEDDPEAEGPAGNQIRTMNFVDTEALTVSNWSDILAVYIAKNSIDVEKPLDLMELRNISFDGLSDVFHDMLRVNVMQTADGADVLVYTCTYEEMAAAYNLNEDQTNLLYELMQPEFQRAFASLTGNTAFDYLSDAEKEAALSALNGDLAMSREKVVSTAYSLVGKLTYFWGGKSNAVGWNSEWGIPRVVTSKNSKTTGKERPYGLDCSGFVSWVFINAAGDPEVLDSIGNGSSNQWRKSSPIGWDEGQPGDLAFLAAPGERNINHVGIVTAVQPDGSYLVAHCSSSKNGVVVTEAWSSGFRYLRRPALLLGEENDA